MPASLLPAQKVSRSLRSPDQESARDVANIPSCFGAFDPSITARSAWGRKANRLQTGSAIADSDAVLLQGG